MNKLDLTTIILTYNEEIHIRRCLENVCPFSKRVIVVDSPSTDRTVEICREFPNVEVVVHTYPGNQAEQFNWALDNLPIDTEWILRLDADEYLFPELVAELEQKLP
ncbi:MAG: glycosyltransferase, partial [Bacteroidaceae bacterium]|nr:glycosyltransferase [Bacteroidaceae bacterium]